ncbi:cytochrome P450 9e2-like [Odontomachus brunneus]|uniref:cytochrome P450 9e2-like n=1 Tax=Odontomachus brunneus TaxID=486640 RepID=UPI0013F23D2F|nr:cytochrome P450 9e2-like [Odontomachus brunneus]
MFVMFVSLIFGALVLLYLYLANNIKYWQKRGIPCANGALPGIGHMWDLLMSRASFNECCEKIYDNNIKHSIVGFYNFITPTLMIRDPELVKTVLQTKFTNFHENSGIVNADVDPLLANNPFFTYGEKWTTGRKRLTYAFSSMRLKILLENVKQVCLKFEDFIDRKMNKTGEVELELKDLFCRYTTQVVASAGFGVDGFCFDDKKQKETFYNIGQELFKPSSLSSIKITIAFLMPYFSKMLRIKLLPEKFDNFFRTLVTNVMEDRRTSGMQKNDFLQLMTELERMEGDKFDIDVLASHAVSFFIDGSETSGSTLSFVGFHVAAYPEVQKKLREEIISVLEKYDNILTYEALREMTYMDQVFNESQRLLPVVTVLNKICTETIDLKGSDGLVYHIEAGTNILIPISSLHNDPHHWEKPNEFDPERFNADRKRSVKKFTHLPFSEGPRSCVGMRMAQLQMKACMATLLKKYSLELSPKTEVPLKMVPSSFLPITKSGLWVFIREL